MFYHAFAAVPEWAPPGENHILYSKAVLSHISYADKKIQYTAMQKDVIDYLRLNFKPGSITLNGNKISLNANTDTEGYTLRDLQGGDYALVIKRKKAGKIVIKGL